VKMSQKSGVRKIFKLVLMTLGLGIIGIAFGLIGVLIGGKVLGGNSVGFASLGLAIGGIIVGYPTGIIVGIVLIRKVLHQRGSLLLGIVGSIIGAVVTMVLAEPLLVYLRWTPLLGQERGNVKVGSCYPHWV